LGDRRNVGENNCNSADGMDESGPIVDVCDDDDGNDDDDDDDDDNNKASHKNKITRFLSERLLR